MAFVKLDCGILNSTLWVEPAPRDVFITALLMAQPYELVEPAPQFFVSRLEKTGFVVPPGWYGFVQAAGPGIVRMSLAEPVAGMAALEALGSPDQESRSSEFEGRRLVRVDGGFIVLNFMKYREKDNTSATRSKRYRDRKKIAEEDVPSRRNAAPVTRDSSRRVTIAEAEAEAEAEKQTHVPSGTRDGGFAEFWETYPKKDGKKKAFESWQRVKFSAGTLIKILSDVGRRSQSQEWTRESGRYIPLPATYLNQQRWTDEGVAAGNGAYNPDAVIAEFVAAK